MIAANTAQGDRGIGSINLLRITDASAGDFLEWSGVNSPTFNGTPTLTGGYGPNQGGSPIGTTMLAFDYGASVTIQLADADHFEVHNASSYTQTGNLWILTAPAS